MAILASCPGVVVEIVSNGQALQEYDDDNPDVPPPNALTKYVEVGESSEFQIKFRFDDAFQSDHDVGASIALNEQMIPGALWSNSELYEAPRIISHASSIVRGEDSISTLHFSKITIGKQIILVLLGSSVHHSRRS